MKLFPERRTNYLKISSCQSMTLCTELRASLNISKALLHTLTHCVADSADCAITILPPASVPLHMPLLVCLFICLPLSLAHVLPSLFVSEYDPAYQTPHFSDASLKLFHVL